eukprot:scaffold301_cov204-Alexandrium_tamarense.AAC.15
MKPSLGCSVDWRDAGALLLFLVAMMLDMYPCTRDGFFFAVLAKVVLTSSSCAEVEAVRQWFYCLRRLVTGACLAVNLYPTRNDLRHRNS